MAWSRYDRNLDPPQKVLPDETIVGFASVPISVTADAAGQGHVSWAAATVGRHMRRCGHGDEPKLNDGDTVNVHAEGDCSSSSQ